jgi:hypothetical protein
MKIDDIAKQLANKVNQEHYIKHYLEKVQRGAYNKGVKDAEAKQLILSGVIERAFYAAREITSTEERGMLFEHVYKEFTDYKKDVLQLNSIKIEAYK